MKTPMQELIEWVRVTLPMDLDTPRLIEQKIESMLEKEKEVIKELHEALTNLLQAADDEGWINDETCEDWEEQKRARKALANTPSEYLR